MRNLKKVLGLVLCLAMMLSIMVVGAGAVFADQKDIDTKHQEAVDACSALNIITGFENGKFVPNDNVTREQTAKMICVLLNGGKDPVLGAGSSSFTDVANNRWSCPYIESCVSQDIIVGVGNNKFAPAGKVTGSQLAKMLLVALGFSPDHQKYAGSAWEVNVNTDASARGFYKDLEDINPSEPLTREHAAQMIWNALNAYEVEYKSVLSTDANGQLTSKTTVQDKVVGSNNDKITLLEDKYNTFNDYGLLTEYHWNTADKDYDYSISDYSFDADARVHHGAYTYASATDYGDLFGSYVKIVATYDKKTSSVKVFGIVPDDSKVVATGILNDLEYSADKEVKIDGTKYKTDDYANGLLAVAYNDFSTKANIFTGTDHDLAQPAFYEMYAIDENGNDKIDLIVYKPVYPAEIKSVGSKKIGLEYLDNASVTPLTADSAKNMVIEDNNIYEGYAKNDYVLVVDQNNNPMDEYTVTKLDSFTGKVTGIRTNNTKLEVESTWYDNDTGKTLRQDGNYEFFNINSFVFYADQKGAASLTDVLYVDDFNTDRLGTKAKVYFYDGTSNTVDVGDVYKNNGETETNVKDETLYTFSLKNGEYELTEVGSPDNLLGYKDAVPQTISKASDNVAGKLTTDKGSMAFNDDAVIFLKYKDADSNKDKVKVISGAVAKNYSQPVAAQRGQVLYDTVSNNDKVVVGFIKTTGDEPNAKGVSGNYAYVTGDTFTTKIDGTKYVGIPVWDGKENLTVYEEGSSSRATKGEVITFDNLGEGYVDNVTIAKNGSYQLAIGAVKSTEDSTFTIYGSNDTYIITKDTTILYISSADKEGSDSGSLAEANAVVGQPDAYVPNVVFVVDEADSDGTNAWKLDLLVVDVDNELSSAFISTNGLTT